MEPPYTVFELPEEDGEWERRDSYEDFDVACDFAEELVRLGADEAKVRDCNGTGAVVHHVAS